MGLRFKKDENDGAVRLAYGDGESLSSCAPIEENPNKIFAVIGPFDGHTDKLELQNALRMLIRGFNVTEK